MSDMTVIELAAKAAYNDGFLSHAPTDAYRWDDISEEARESWRKVARAALAAARPLIEAEVRNAVAAELVASTVTTSTPLDGWHIYDADGEPGLFHVCPGSDPDLGVCAHSDDAMSLTRIVAEIRDHRCRGGEGD